MEKLKLIIINHLKNHFNNEVDLMAVNFENKVLLDYHLGSVVCNNQEFFIFLLSLLPHTQPHFLTQEIQKHLPQGGDFPEIGGIKNENFRGIFPTLETALFFLKPQTAQERIEIYNYFEPEHFFYTQNILHLEDSKEGNPFIASKLQLTEEVLHKLLFNKVYTPKFSSNFPAQKITTQQVWEDLVINENAYNGITEIENWVNHHTTLNNTDNMVSKLKKGYRVLFYGAPGTGKTLTAKLLGKKFNRDVYRVDLSTVVSKYIGETEKNLSKLFDAAEHKDWILFFDEADSLFGKRTQVNDAHDKYANQGTSYLLQRIEDYDGLVILSTNLKGNIDSAFKRRIQTSIEFNKPNKEQRLLLWNKILPPSIPLDLEINIKTIADTYSITGANITNIVQKVSLAALAENTDKPKITYNQLFSAIKQEYQKENRVMEG